MKTNEFTCGMYSCAYQPGRWQCVAGESCCTPFATPIIVVVSLFQARGGQEGRIVCGPSVYVAKKCTR